MPKRSHFKAGVLTPALTKGDVQPPLETPFNGSTLQAAWSSSHDDNSNGVLFVPKTDRLTVRQHLVDFVPSNSMFFPNFLRDERRYDELVEPQFGIVAQDFEKTTGGQQVGWVEPFDTRFALLRVHGIGGDPPIPNEAKTLDSD